MSIQDDIFDVENILNNYINNDKVKKEALAGFKRIVEWGSSMEMYIVQNRPIIETFNTMVRLAADEVHRRSKETRKKES